MTLPRRVTSVAVASLLFVVALFALPLQASAAATPALSMTTSPVTLNLSVKPGSSTTQTLKLRNNGAQPLQISMHVDVFGAYGDTGEAAITQAAPGNTSPSWVHFSPSSFVAQPGVLNSVIMTIDLPKTASLGYYYAVIFQPAIANPTTTSNSAVVKGSNAILVLIDTHSANESRSIQIANFSVTKKVYEYLPATFNVTIRNSGNIYLAPTGNIFISRNSNLTHTLDTITFNPGGANVLPDSIRTFSVAWSDGFPVFKPVTHNGQPVDNKKGQAVEALDWNTSTSISKIRFGKYYAQLALVYNNGAQVVPVTGVVSFWVIPWKLILIIIFGLIAFIILWRLTKKFIKKLWRKLHKK